MYEDNGRKEGKLYFYVVGNNKSENLKSECVIVEYSDNECVITNYDTDSDLLCDYLEYCYGTDVENKDTDGDGLSDYNETGIVYNIDNRYIGKNNSIRVRYFKLRSNPTKKDSDLDGIIDKEDSYPWKKNRIVIASLQKKYTDTEYINVKNDKEITIGGNQGWWKEKMKSPYKNSAKVDPFLYSVDPAYRIVRLGCGVIAMCDAELYCCIHRGYEPFCLDGNIKYDRKTGIIDRKEYINYKVILYDKEKNYKDNYYYNFYLCCCATVINVFNILWAHLFRKD